MNPDDKKNEITVFEDDFQDSIWIKSAQNPVMVRSQLWAESHYICEPNIVFDGSLFHMWYSQMYPANGKTALGYATSIDGFEWIKYPNNPVLSLDQTDVHRPYVIQHDGKYHLYAVDDENGENAPATMRRWISCDGINWGDERLILTATQQWEQNGLSNTSVVVDENERWHMLYTSDRGIGGNFGYAWSSDGIMWTKHEANPVIRDLYGGDPFLIKLGEWFYTWHSEAKSGSLRITCRRSLDMVDWQIVDYHPQINYTQTWERGVSPEDGGTVNGWYGHLTDATLCEANGRVYLVYQGAQTPLGVATFDGTFIELAKRLSNPPLSRWEPSHFGMVEGGTLKLADNDSERAPLVVKIPDATDSYTIQTRIRCYSGPTHSVSVVIRYADVNTFNRVWLHDTGQVFYQECLNGLFSLPKPIGNAPICDDTWHDWEVEINRANICLTIDEQLIGDAQISPALFRVLIQHPVHIGFSTQDTWASIACVRVKRCKNGGMAS